MTLNSWIAALTALGGHAPAMQAAAIILATFTLEDAATVMAAMEAQQGTLPRSHVPPLASAAAPDGKLSAE